MKKSVYRILLLIFLVPFVAQSQSPTPQDSLLDRMTGKWVLRGTIDGQETTHDIDAGWVLNHEYLQIREVSREKDVNGKPLYEAIVYLCWEQGKSQYSCLWLDNTGNGGLSSQAVGHAKTDGNKIGLLFSFGGGGLFHTNFIYDKGNDSWLWTMDGEQNGKLQPFARVALTRE